MFGFFGVFFPGIYKEIGNVLIRQKNGNSFNLSKYVSLLHSESVWSQDFTLQSYYHKDKV